MPSPFPGMDPYLEDPESWSDVHRRLMTYIADDLNRALPRGYVARLEERLSVLEPGRDVYPDVTVLERPLPPFPGSATPIVTPSAATDEPFLVLLESEERREMFINIRTSRGGGGDAPRVVTSLELLSPAHKAAGPGRDQYLKKQREALASSVSLIEIDLLRRGTPVLVPPPSLLATYAPFDYAVSLHRAGDGPRFRMWLRTVRERLPAIAVPLTDGEPDVALDLQAAFDRCYDAGRYADTLDYAAEPLPPLSPADAAWADELLRAAGLRA